MGFTAELTLKEYILTSTPPMVMAVSLALPPFSVMKA
jgi:hypothetical protein